VEAVESDQFLDILLKKCGGKLQEAIVLDQALHWAQLAKPNWHYPFFGGGIGVRTQGFQLTKQLVYHLSHASSPFCSGYFGDGVT
jgi:hypothetical protein